MTDETWQAVGVASDFSVGDICAADLGGREVIVCRTEAGFAVLERRCLHAGADLAEGLIVGADIICPLHGWCYRADTGVHVQSAVNRLASFAVRVTPEGVILARTQPRTP